MNKQRNRHTGRINAAKQYVIDKGELLQDSRGNIYAVMDVSQPYGDIVMRKCSIVKVRNNV